MGVVRFGVGQQIWIGDFAPLAPLHETCHDCGGTGRLRVTFHDDTQVSIGCQNCTSGYDAPTGRIVVYRNDATARLATINGLEVSGGRVRWHVDAVSGSYRIVDDEDAFTNEVDALASAKARAAAYEAEQRDKIFRKEKDDRTWAWNASYHRGQIKQAELRIAYHTAKLNVAKIKAKEPNATLPTTHQETE